MSIPQHLPTASLAHLQARAELLRRLRVFFDTRGFFEVHTPVLSADTMVDHHLDPFRVTLFGDPARPAAGPTGFLQTSPEFHMKRLVAAGAEAIYQVCPAFRAGERGRLHNPEFTIVEWYRVGDTMRDGMGFLSDLVASLLNCPAATCQSYSSLFQHQTGLDPRTASLDQLQETAAQTQGPRTTDRDELLQWIMAAQIEPAMPADRPLIVYHFPASQAALARLSDEDPRVAERFELYFRGVELANGYHELLDVDQFTSRLRLANRQRQAAGKPPLPEKNRLTEALQQGLPACAGVALGFDRLVMLALAVQSIDQVLAFPFDRA